MNWLEKIEDLKKRRNTALEMGGPERVKRQHDEGKLTARKRIDLLFDRGTFTEYGMLAMSPSERLKKEKKTPADAVITGYGKIKRRMACTIAEDFTVLGGYGAGQAAILAWPTADFWAIPMAGGILAAYKKEIEAAPDPDLKRQELEKEFSEIGGPYAAAANMNVDDVIDPRETRPRIIRALELSLNSRKVAAAPVYRHGIMP